MALVFRYSGRDPQAPRPLWDTGMTRGTAVHIFKARPDVLGVPLSFPSGWKDFLHGWALVPEFTAVGSSRSSKYIFFFPSFRGRLAVGKKSWDYLKAGWEDQKVCWKNDIPKSQRIGHTPNGFAPWETLLNCAGPEMGLDTAPACGRTECSFSSGLFLPPFLWGVTRREGNRVTTFPKEQPVEVARGQRLNAGVNKVKGIFGGRRSRSVGRLGKRWGRWDPCLSLSWEKTDWPLLPPPSLRPCICALVVVIWSFPSLTSFSLVVWHLLSAI